MTGREHFAILVGDHGIVGRVPVLGNAVAQRIVKQFREGVMSCAQAKDAVRRLGVLDMGDSAQEVGRRHRVAGNGRSGCESDGTGQRRVERRMMAAQTVPVDRKWGCVGRVGLERLRPVLLLMASNWQWHRVAVIGRVLVS